MISESSGYSLLKGERTLTPPLSDTSHEDNIDYNPLNNGAIEKFDDVPLNIVHFSSEVFPYIFGGLGLATSGIALTQKAKGHNVVVVLPYSDAVKNYGEGSKIVTTVTISLANGHSYNCLVLRNTLDSVPIYFIHHPYLNGGGIYSYTDKMSTAHNIIPTAAMEVIKRVIFPSHVDVIHCHDWTTALGCYVMRRDNFFFRTVSVFTVHNFAHQGILNAEDALQAGFDSSLFNEYLMLNNHFNMLRIGLIFADRITTVSPNYCDESLSNSCAHGNEDVLIAKARKGEYEGITNGIQEEWNPAYDSTIYKTYNTHTFEEGKRVNKLAFQQQCGIAVDANIPLLTACSRITHQKGFQFLLELIPDLLELNVQVAIIGDVSQNDVFGADILNKLKKHAEKNPSLIYVSKFSVELEKQSAAAADMFYMCSLFEPCGISNQHAAKYGAVVIGTPVGGIMNTTVDFRTEPKNGTGFVAQQVNTAAIRDALKSAIKLYYNDKEMWKKIVYNAMSRDASWSKPVDRILTIYRQALHSRSQLTPPAPVPADHVAITTTVPQTTAIKKLRNNWKCCKTVEFDIQLLFRFGEIIHSCKTPPGRADFMYVIFKASLINLFVRSFFLLSYVSEGEITVMYGVASIVWYQLQDVFFTLFGQTYFKFLGSISGLLKVGGARFGDMLFVFFMLFVLEWSNRLIVGPVGGNASAYTPYGIAVILYNLIVGMVSGGPVDPAISKLRETGVVSHKTAMHIYQITGLTLLFGLFATFGYQTLYDYLMAIQFTVATSIYLTFTVFENPSKMVRRIQRFLTRLFCSHHTTQPTLGKPSPRSLREVDLNVLSNVVYSPSPECWNDEVIYSILIDRFNIGRPGVDLPSSRDKLGDTTRHGGDIPGITKKLDYIQDLGVTVLLLSPVQTNPIHAFGLVEAYHGYAPINLMEVDPHLGTMEDLKTLVDEAHDRGIRIVLDFTINHMGPVFEYEGDHTFVEQLADGPRKLGKWTYNIKPEELASEEHFSRYGVLNDWYDDVQIRNGDFPPNNRRLATDNPATQDILINILRYWIKETNIDGFRLDAAKHVHPQFLERMSKEIRAYASRLGKNNFLLLAEVSTIHDNELLPMLVPNAVGTAFNYPDYRRSNHALHAQSPTRDLDISALYSAKALGPYVSQVVRFIDNHDVFRFLHQEDPDTLLNLALSYLLFSIGMPMIYYGTELCFRQSYEGLEPESSTHPADPGNRANMFQPRPFDPMKTTIEKTFDTSNPMYSFISRLISVRNTYAALRRGTQKWRYSTPDGPGVFAFSRLFDGMEVLVIINSADEDKVAEIPLDRMLARVGEEYQDVLEATYVVSTVASKIPEVGPTVTVKMSARGPSGVRVMMKRMYCINERLYARSVM